MVKKARIKPRKRNPDSERNIDLANERKDQVREYFNSARINIDYSIIKEDARGKIFIVTSSLKDEGKTFCSLNLARSFGSIKENRVILVDCDLHAPKIHRFLNIPGKPGLTDFLTNKTTFLESCVYNDEENFYIMTSGTKVPNPSVFFSGSIFKSFLKELEEQFDYVIIDTPPVLQVTDVASFAIHVDGVILVVRAGESKKPELKRTMETLEKAQANILGVILKRC